MITLMIARLALTTLIAVAGWALFWFVASAAVAVVLRLRGPVIGEWILTGERPARAEGMPIERPGCGKDAVVLLAVLIGAAVAAWVVLR